MSTRKSKRVFTAGIAALLAIGLAACGGSSNNVADDASASVAVDLMGSTDLMVGDTTIPAGRSVTVGATTIACPADGDDCTITISKDPVTGTYTAMATGGTPTVAVAPPPTPTTVDLMGSMDLMAGTTTIPAGSSTTIGYTTVSCPAGGDDCVLTIVKDSVTGGYTATATGGMPTVAVVQPVMVDLMGSTDLGMGTITVAAGESTVVGRTTVECPADGEDCVLTVAKNSVTGEYTATSIGGMPMVSVAPIVHYADLPKEHGLSDGDTFTVDAGDSVKMGGVEFTCPASGGDCVVTIMENDDGDLVASYTGGAEGLMAMQLTPRGFLAFIHSNTNVNDLSDTILDSAQLMDLQQNIYHGTRAGGGSGVTSSVTTHEEPTGTDPNVYGVSDIQVTVTTDQDDPTRDDDTHRIDVVNTASNSPVRLAAPAFEYEEAVHKDSSTSWDGEIAVTATWDANPAAGWTVDAIDLGSDANVDDDDEDVWSAYFRHVDDTLAGGRTLELDLRTDFGPGHWRHITYDGTMQTIVRGAGFVDLPESTVDWEDVMFDDTRYHLGLGAEVDLPISDAGGEGLEGGYRAADGHFVRGRFVCIDGGAPNAGGTADGECEIDHQSPGRMSVSEQDSIVFLPYVHGDDANWLAAGVWLTIPDDEEDGDYAVGAFVFGNDPVERTVDGADNIRALMGEATYNGNAFGRYAEDRMIDAQSMVVGRFTADVELVADFDAGGGAAGGTGNDFGSISGDVTNFVAEGEKKDWDVNFESAMIMLPEGPNPDPNIVGTVMVDGALRFNAAASGHGGGGNALTGYWNGQFYGDPLQVHNDNDPIVGGIQPPWEEDTLPGSAAGTFGLTSERDDDDNYLLIMEGAFAAHQEGAQGAPLAPAP